MELTTTQLDLMEHALGRTERYRNYFVACVGSDDYCEWKRLVTQGFAEERTYPLAPCSAVFRVTKQGIEALNRRDHG